MTTRKSKWKSFELVISEALPLKCKEFCITEQCVVCGKPRKADHIDKTVLRQSPDGPVCEFCFCESERCSRCKTKLTCKGYDICRDCLNMELYPDDKPTIDMFVESRVYNQTFDATDFWLKEDERKRLNRNLSKLEAGRLKPNIKHEIYAGMMQGCIKKGKKWRVEDE